MKQVISFCLISAIFMGSALPLSAQKGRRVSPVKVGSVDPPNRFGEVRAFSEGEGVLIKWKMAAETNGLGFVVYRTDQNGSRIVSPSAILGSAARYGKAKTRGEEYSYFDADGDRTGSYYVRSISADGTSLISETAVPEFVNDLSSVASVGSAELERQISDTKTRGKLEATKLSLPKTLAGEVAAGRIESDAVNHRWVISQPGTRIGVRKDGLYRVTRAELQAGGFNVNSDPNFWQIYLEGVEQAMIVGPNADYIEFFGKGIDTPESDMRMYYLVSGPTSGKRIEVRSARPIAGTVTAPSYSQTTVTKERTTYLNQVLNGDLENYWGQSITIFGDVTVNFTLTGIDTSVPNATMLLKFQGYSFDPHVVRVMLNGQQLANATGTTQNPFSQQYTVPTSLLHEGSNALTFLSLGTSSDFSLFDSVSVSYARKPLAVQNRLSFYTQNYRISQLDGFSSSNIRVFDTTTEATPVQFSNLNVTQNGGTFGVTMPADRGRLMYAVEDSGLLQAASVTVNNPELLALPTNGANLVIISYKDFLPQAENWANYRRGQGFSVKVVEVSEIYDEFNYGVLSAESIRSFLQYAKVNWQTAPTYVLIIGDASYDSRNYEGFGYLNLVPTKIVATIFNETGSDDALADFNNDGLAEMAIGRIPARDAQSVTNALAKVVAFEPGSTDPFDRGALFAYDQYDSTNNYDFQQISVRIRNNLPSSLPVTMVGKSDVPPPPDTSRTVLINAINTGKYIVNYAGHGASGGWSNSGAFFSIFDVPLLTNANNQSIFTMLTCLNGFFLQPNRVSLAEALVNATNGGAVAAWASTGETTPDVQEAMANRFYLKIGQGTIPRLGDLINDAKTTIPGGTDVRLSWALIGDPMLKVRIPHTGDRPQ